jgi:hypothetical protein
MNRRSEITDIFARAGISPGLSLRAAVVPPATPASSGADDGGLRWILTTEAPATVFDWERFDFVSEILLMDGLVLPATKQVPLLDSHSRYSVDDILGSVTDIREAEAGGYAAVDGLVRFASDERAQRVLQLVRDGHLTDGSVGYRVDRAVWIPEGEQAAIRGRVFEGPVKVSHKWSLKEFSATPIGADALAKVRSLCTGERGR